MKFHQFKIGQQFEYQDQTFVKTTPLVATQIETGEQKLIPRYVELNTNEKQEVTNNTSMPELTIALVSHAIEQHEKELMDITKMIKNSMTGNISTQLIDRIENACQNLYDKLGLKK